MKRLTIIPLAVSAILLAACGNIGPDLFSKPPDISGHWTFEASSLIQNLTNPADGVSCSVSGYRLRFDQNDRARNFTGTYSGGRLTCVFPGGILLDSLASGTIVNGIIGMNSFFSSADVEFDFDTRDAHHEGNVDFGDPNKMGGTATWRIDFGGDIGSVSLVGEWMAVR